MDRRLKRVFVIVLDSMGMGAMADAARFGDEGADTLGHISQTVEHFYIPNLASLGLANLKSLKQVQPQEHPLGYYAALNEKSNGKDTMTGHWEMMGIETKKPFITFTEHGFPPELIAELEKRCGRKIIGNRAESGTKILEELGEQEIREGKLIVYTSADSVLQICGNEEYCVESTVCDRQRGWYSATSSAGVSAARMPVGREPPPQPASSPASRRTRRVAGRFIGACRRAATAAVRRVGCAGAA